MFLLKFKRHKLLNVLGNFQDHALSLRFVEYKHLLFYLPANLGARDSDFVGKVIQSL